MVADWRQTGGRLAAGSGGGGGEPTTRPTALRHIAYCGTCLRDSLVHARNVLGVGSCRLESFSHGDQVPHALRAGQAPLNHRGSSKKLGKRAHFFTAAVGSGTLREGLQLLGTVGRNARSLHLGGQTVRSTCMCSPAATPATRDAPPLCLLVRSGRTPSCCHISCWHTDAAPPELLPQLGCICRCRCCPRCLCSSPTTLPAAGAAAAAPAASAAASEQSALAGSNVPTNNEKANNANK